MPEPPDSNLLEKLEVLAAKVRDSSRTANIVKLEQVWPGTEDEFLEAVRTEGVSSFEDINLIHASGSVYLCSDRHMTRRYAEIAACIQSQDVRHIIADTVRSDSLTHPRPTPVEMFCEPPYLLKPEVLAAALEGISDDPRYADIRLVHASEGSRFLFSTNHLDPSYAESLAEWMAVGDLEHP
jgi:hypothetical protein